MQNNDSFANGDPHAADSSTGSVATGFDAGGQEEEGKPAWNGFLEIIHDPVSVGKRLLASPGKIVAAAALIYAFGMVGVTMLLQSNEFLKKEMHTMIIHQMEELGRANNMPPEALEEQKKWADFGTIDSVMSFSLSLGGWLMAGFVSLFFFGGVFWLLARILVPEPPHYLVVSAFVGFGYLLNVIGKLVNVLLQHATDSLQTTLSLTLFLDGESKWSTMIQLQNVLAQINIFNIWEFVVVGIAVAAASRLSTAKGAAFGIVGFAILMLFHTLTALPYLFL